MVSEVREKFLYYTGKPRGKVRVSFPHGHRIHTALHSFFSSNLFTGLPDIFSAEITNRQMGSLAEAFSICLLSGLKTGLCEVTEHVPRVTSRELLEGHTKLLHFGKLCA